MHPTRGEPNPYGDAELASLPPSPPTLSTPCFILASLPVSIRRKIGPRASEDTHMSKSRWRVQGNPPPATQNSYHATGARPHFSDAEKLTSRPQYMALSLPKSDAASWEDRASVGLGKRPATFCRSASFRREEIHVRQSPEEGASPSNLLVASALSQFF